MSSSKSRLPRKLKAALCEGSLDSEAGRTALKILVGEQADDGSEGPLYYLCLTLN